MKILLTPDSFKGSLTASEVSQIIEEQINELCPHAEVVKFPLADGGEGSGEILKINHFPVTHKINVHNPAGEIIVAEYYGDSVGFSAFIESSKAIGLPLVSTKKRNAIMASSFGLGELILDAVNKGYKDIYIALGGSATSDGGAGLLEALGVKFLDKKGKEINFFSDGYKNIIRIDHNKLKERFGNIKFHAVCDVENPLIGRRGAVKVFSPQKGADFHNVLYLENRIRHFYNLTKREKICGKGEWSLRGAGAAGGIGFTLQTYLKARYINGIEFIFQLVNFNEIFKNADIIVTGEGKVDTQSLMGKVLSGILHVNEEFKKPLFVIGGIIEDEESLLKSGITELIEIADKRISIEENMQKNRAAINLRNGIKKIFNNKLIKQIKD